MKLANKIILKFKDQRGVTALVVALALAMLLGFAALAIDVGYLYATKNELQNIADAAALAAAGKLGEIYLVTTDPKNYTCDRTNIVPSAQAVVGAGKNRAGGKNIVIRDEDIYINNLLGAGTTRFDINDYFHPDAVRVIARRDSIINTSISTFFARVFNINSVPVVADATAALTGPSKIAPEGLPLPLGIAKKRFEDEPYCDEPIYFHPSKDPDACAGWHTYDDEFGKIKVKILPDLIDDDFITPKTKTGDIYHFDGGVIDPAFVLLKELFDKNKLLNDGKIDLDDDVTTWTASVVVYDWDNCDNPNTAISIIGFSAITVYGVCHADIKPCTVIHENLPDGQITVDATSIIATIACEKIKPNRGGGSNYGTLGSIPNLVE